MARPTMSALSAEPLRVTSPFSASTSMDALDTSLSAFSLPLIMVSITSSSDEPVGAPTTLSLVRTMVTPRSRSACNSVEPRRHSVIREETSLEVLLDAAREPDAPVVLVEPAPAAPVVPVELPGCEVVSVATEALELLGLVVVSVATLDVPLVDLEVSVAVVSVELVLAAPVAATLPVAPNEPVEVELPLWLAAVLGLGLLVVSLATVELLPVAPVEAVDVLGDVVVSVAAAVLEVGCVCEVVSDE